MFSLLFAVTCAGLTYPSTGLFLCNGDVTKVVIHTPNSSKGQISLMDINSQSVFDYGNIYTLKGFWFWKRKIVEYKSQAIDLNLSSNNNPLYIGVSNIDNPTVYGRIEKVNITSPLGISIQCGGRTIRTDMGELLGWFGNGVAICRALSDSSLYLNFNIKGKTIISIVSTDCQEDERTISFTESQTFDYEIKVQNKICNYYISQQTLEDTRRAIITVEGQDRTSIKITNPIMFDKKVFKPVLATSIEVEQYIGNKVMKKDSSKNDFIDVNWFTEGTLCSFAYSSLGQITSTCFNPSGEEVPNFFR